MSARQFTQTRLHEALKRSLLNIKLNPKLKKPSKDALPPDELPVSTTNDPAFKKQIMGFREWCEKVYEPSRSSSTRPGNVR